MRDANTQEHERTVSAARLSMTFHDEHQALRRWFDNYKDDKSAHFCSGWCVVTREGCRWKIEFGYGDARTLYTHYADCKAPAPPVFEFRPPPPEPVKPRFNVPEAPVVPAWDRGTFDAMSVIRMFGVPQRRFGGGFDSFDLSSGWNYRDAFRFDRRAFDRPFTPPPPAPTRRNQ